MTSFNQSDCAQYFGCCIILLIIIFEIKHYQSFLELIKHNSYFIIVYNLLLKLTIVETWSSYAVHNTSPSSQTNGHDLSLNHSWTVHFHQFRLYDFFYAACLTFFPHGSPCKIFSAIFLCRIFFFGNSSTPPSSEY